VEVDMGDALAHHVVQREPGPGVGEGRPLGRGHAPTGVEEGSKEVGGQVGEVGVVTARHDQGVPLEHRTDVEERHQVGLVEDDMTGPLPGDDVVEDAVGDADSMAEPAS
jgi:hypothetical protein